MGRCIHRRKYSNTEVSKAQGFFLEIYFIIESSVVSKSNPTIQKNDLDLFYYFPLSQLNNQFQPIEK